MTVKEILQGLVDDGLVDTDRIGTSNYFWAFPSKASNKVCCISVSVCVCVFITTDIARSVRKKWMSYRLN